MDVEQGTNNALRDFDNKSTTSRRNKILAGVGIGCLVLGGVAVGVYFGVSSSSSSSNSNNIGPAPDTPVTTAASAYPYWASQYPLTANVEGSSTTPNSIWLATANAILSDPANKNIHYPQFINLLGTFAGLTQDQFNQWKGHDPAATNTTNTPIVTTVSDKNFLTAGIVDWRTNANVVTPVKNQAQCGSCWAFTATQGVESAYGVLTGATPYNLAAYTAPRGSDTGQGNVVGFSPQQITSCDSEWASQGAGGCNGGDAPTTINNYLSTVSFASSADYPYADSNGNSIACNSGYVSNAATYGKTNPQRGLNVGKNAAQQIGNCYSGSKCPYTAAQENAVQVALASGPLMVAVDASGFNSYSGGIVDGKNGASCDTTGDTTKVDHAIQLVGYNTQVSPGYWIVKNQWGTTWGENGYIRFATGMNACCLLCFPAKVTLPSSYAGTTTTKSPTVTTRLPTTYIPSVTTTTSSSKLTTKVPSGTTSKPTVPATTAPKPTIAIVTTNAPSNPSIPIQCDVNALTAQNEMNGCYTTSPAAAGNSFQCIGPDKSTLYWCCYTGGGNWAGSLSYTYSKLAGVIISMQCLYQPAGSQPQYPPLPNAPSASSNTYSISYKCVSSDEYGNDLAYWNAGACYDIASGAIDNSGLECSNPPGGTPAISQYGSGCPN